MNILKSFFSGQLEKEKIIIFGTGGGGYYLYNAIKSKKHIVGFLDNNHLKHGTVFCNKRVYAPSEVHGLKFDKIIIASDYYKEIYQQLTDELGIRKNNISLYHAESITEKGSLATIRNRYNHLILNNICSRFDIISKISYIISSLFSTAMKMNQVYNLQWLDKLEGNELLTFLEKHNSFSYPPKFIGEEQRSHAIVIPNISAYRFEDAIISPTNSAIILDEERAVIVRVPSMMKGSADYSGGNIVAHSNKKILLRKLDTEFIEKGIAITGSSDTNYYHWVLEVLSKLQYIQHLPKSYISYPIMISEKAKEIPSIKKLFSLFNVKNKVIWLNSIQQYRVGDLIYITPPNYLIPNLSIGEKYQAPHCYVNIDSIRYIKNIALSIQKNESKSLAPKRIFLARKPFIRDYNQEEVIALLAQYNFTAIYLEDMTFEEQLNSMQQAEFIIGPTGAAWTNLIFVNSGIKALTWIAKESGDFSGYSSIAYHTEIQLDFITYNAGTHDSRGLYFMPYKIDCRKIEEWLINNLH